MNLADAILLVILLIGILDGVRKGALRSIISFVGSILTLYLSWIFKGKIAVILIDKFKMIGNNAVISAIIYNIIAFIILFLLLNIILKLILKVTKIIDKVLDATVILGMASRLVGAIIGFVETYILLFFALFLINMLDVKFFEDSKVSDFILEETPLIEDKLVELKDINENSNIKDNLNKLLDNDFINEETLNKLLNKENN